MSKLVLAVELAPNQPEQLQQNQPQQELLAVLMQVAQQARGNLSPEAIDILVNLFISMQNNPKQSIRQQQQQQQGRGGR
jgi:hypothetical protein